jgi:hypothetical protein
MGMIFEGALCKAAAAGLKKKSYENIFLHALDQVSFWRILWFIIKQKSY